MNEPESGRTSLAMDLGVRESGWAMLLARQVANTGVIGLTGRSRVDAVVRIEHIIKVLDALAERCQPDDIPYCQPSGLRWEVPSLRLLDTACTGWLEARELPALSYTTQEVRLAFTGNPHAPTGLHGYEAVTKLQLVGHEKKNQRMENDRGRFLPQHPSADPTYPAPSAHARGNDTRCRNLYVYTTVP